MLALCLSMIADEEQKRQFEAIYLGFRKQMVQMACSVLHQKEEAEDAVQDVFLKIATKYMDTVSRIENETDLRNYLLTAVKNTALNRIRSRKTECQAVEKLRFEHSFSSQELSDDRFTEAICSKLTACQVIEQIKKMGPIYSDVLYYHFAVGLSVSETARLMQLKPSAVKQRLVRGKKLLLSVLKEKEDV